MITRQLGKTAVPQAPPGSLCSQAAPCTCSTGTKAAPIRRLRAFGRMPGTSVQRGDGASRCMNIRARMALTLRAHAAYGASGQHDVAAVLDRQDLGQHPTVASSSRSLTLDRSEVGLGLWRSTSR